MPDLKISQLTAATTPLDGTEVLPIVQAGTTDQVTVANLTAGRAISATSLTVGAGAVGTPSLTTSGDLNTGVWFPAADTVSASTGGVEALRINSSQEVIVGNGDAVASPASRTLRGTDGNGANIAGGNITVQAGRGTGTGTGGYIRFMTSPALTTGSTLQTALERVRIDHEGRIGIKTAPAARSDVVLGGTSASDSGNSLCFAVENTIPSTTTGQAQIFRSSANTAAASFTLSGLSHFICGRGSLGAGSVVINEFGFIASLSLTGATNEYGFYGDIASGTGRWNFYAAGTAANFFAGNVGVGAASAGARLHVHGTGQSPANFFMDNSYFVGFSGNQNSSQIGFVLQGKDAGGSLLPGAYVTINTGAANPELAFYAPGSSNGVIRFGQNNGTGGFVEQLRFDAGGRAQFTANLVMPYQGAPTSKGAAATLTGAELVAGMLQYTGGSATVNLPTGTDIEGALTWAANNVSLDLFVVNTGSGTCTIGANGNTTVGTLTVSAGTSAQFRIRRTATNAFTVYRVG